jgi:hypothetical protein
MRRTVRAVGLGAVLALAACAQGQDQSWIDEEPFPQTQAELYQKYGTPDVIRRDGDVRRLRYDYGEGKGMTLGARYYGLGLILSRYHSQADRVWVLVDQDNRITGVETSVNTDDLRYQLWPFGD